MTTGIGPSDLDTGFQYFVVVDLPLPRLDLLIRAIQRCPVLGTGRDSEAHGWYPSHESGLVPESDLAPAAWIRPLLTEDSFQVRMTVPQGFEAYARIFFPFDEHLTWTEMARRNGRIAHALMEEETIQAAPGRHRAHPYWRMAPEQVEALLPILTRHASSPRGWFLLWEGFGDLDHQAFRPLPKARHPMRDYYLLSGPHVAYGEFPDDPNYWWPDDRAWCVCTDTDFHWAYIAGSAACIRDVLSVPVLDAYQTKPEDPAHGGMDTINNPRQTIPRP